MQGRVSLLTHMRWSYTVHKYFTEIKSTKTLKRVEQPVLDGWSQERQRSWKGMLDRFACVAVLPRIRNATANLKGIGL